ncbi:hypothetical protein [Actinophytocola glycyrrhizae]|uniref:Immunity protein 51 of polymorphic toxin system n=1 Tax=Actinophytocola glycyrrhizae TaxID=2044873 RepID=A0ABV9RUN8_9PSEU
MQNSMFEASEGWEGSIYRVRTSSFNVAFVIGAGEDPDEIDTVDVEVTLADGSCWSATMFTLAEVERLMARWAVTGEYGGGSYFWCSDGVIVREPGVTNMTMVLAQLYEDGQLTDVLERLDRAEE